MRIFTVSDLHIDYSENEKWFFNLSNIDYQDDVLILAGDISDDNSKLAQCFTQFKKKFRYVLYVPGNHDLWVHRSQEHDSIEKFHTVTDIAHDCDIITNPLYLSGVCIIPLLSWYDFSFGQPNLQLEKSWMDFKACAWPNNWDMKDVTQFFLNQNPVCLKNKIEKVISFSHFLPRIDLLPSFIPASFHYLRPIMGTPELDKQLHLLKSNIHIYGHSHINRQTYKNNILYINNAFGYPTETRISKKNIICVHTI